MQIVSWKDNLYEMPNLFSGKNQKEYFKMSSAAIFPQHVCFVCVEVLRPSQPNGVMSSAVSLPNHTFTGQA